MANTRQAAITAAILSTPELYSKLAKSYMGIESFVLGTDGGVRQGKWSTAVELDYNQAEFGLLALIPIGGVHRDQDDKIIDVPLTIKCRLIKLNENPEHGSYGRIFPCEATYHCHHDGAFNSKEDLILKNTIYKEILRAKTEIIQSTTNELEINYIASGNTGTPSPVDVLYAYTPNPNGSSQPQKQISTGIEIPKQPGVTLDEFLYDNQIKVEKLWQILRGIGEALLIKCHNNKIEKFVHGDLHLGNVLIDATENSFVLNPVDFGRSKKLRLLPESEQGRCIAEDIYDLALMYLQTICHNLESTWTLNLQYTSEGLKYSFKNKIFTEDKVIPQSRLPPLLSRWDGNPEFKTLSLYVQLLISYHVFILEPTCLWIRHLALREKPEWRENLLIYLPKLLTQGLENREITDPQQIKRFISLMQRMLAVNTENRPSLREVCAEMKAIENRRFYTRQFWASLWHSADTDTPKQQESIEKQGPPQTLLHYLPAGMIM